MSDPTGFALVTHDKFDTLPCNEVISARNAAADDVKALTERIDKSDGIGGAIANTIAYRSELAVARGRVAAAERSIAKNRCEPALQ